MEKANWFDAARITPVCTGFYLVTTADHVVTSALYQEGRGFLTPSGFDGNWQKLDVIGWGFLPKPYRREEDEE